MANVSLNVGITPATRAAPDHRVDGTRDEVDHRTGLSNDKLRRTPVNGRTSTEPGGAFRFSNAAWVGNNHIVYDGLCEQGLILLSATDGVTRRLTQPETSHGESGHFAPVVMLNSETILLTIRRERSGPFAPPGELGFGTLDSAAGKLRVMRLGVQIRRAVAFLGL